MVELNKRTGVIIYVFHLTGHIHRANSVSIASEKKFLLHKKVFFCLMKYYWLMTLVICRFSTARRTTSCGMGEIFIQHFSTRKWIYSCCFLFVDVFVSSSRRTITVIILCATTHNNCLWEVIKTHSNFLSAMTNKDVNLSQYHVSLQFDHMKMLSRFSSAASSALEKWIDAMEK